MAINYNDAEDVCLLQARSQRTQTAVFIWTL